MGVQENFYEPLWKYIKKRFPNDNDEQIRKFIEKCIDVGIDFSVCDFNKGIDDFDEYIFEIWDECNEVVIHLSAIYKNDEYKVRVALDPVECYNKPRDCSIQAFLPLEKDGLDEVLNKIHNVIFGEERKKWFKTAPDCFGGEYALFE